jgi:hypothetical protein
MIKAIDTMEFGIPTKIEQGLNRPAFEEMADATEKPCT